MKRHVTILLLTFGIMTASALPVFAQRVALLIGNGAYSAPDMDLRNPANDVTALGAALRDLSFDVMEVTDSNAAEMQSALGRFERAAQGSEMAVFFYAGHGVQIGNENHLIGTDFSGGELGALRRSSITIGDVRALMARASPEIGLIILDACRNNPFTAKGLVPPGLVRDPGSAGLLIAYATDPGNVAYDGLGDNSAYTSALLKHIATPGLDARLMLGRVRQDVVLQTGGRQIPWVEEAVLGEHSFNPSSTLDAPTDVQTAELAQWRKISGSLKVADFQAYLDDFPNGLFERLAQDRIVALKSADGVTASRTADDMVASADAGKLTAALAALGLPSEGTLTRGVRVYQQRLTNPALLSEAQLYSDAAQMAMFLGATTLQQVRTDLIALRSIQRTMKISEDALAQMEEIAKTNADAVPLVTQAKRDINAIRRAQGVVLRRLDQSRTYYDEVLTQSSVFFPDNATLALLGAADTTRDMAAAGATINENASLFLGHLAQVDEMTKGSYKWLADLLEQS